MTASRRALFSFLTRPYTMAAATALTMSQSHASTSSTTPTSSKPDAQAHPITVTGPSLLPSYTRLKQPHWLNDEGTKFHNPWTSFRQTTTGEVFNMLLKVNSGPKQVELEKTARERIAMVVPDFGRGLVGKEGEIKATWLGHSCFLIEFPSSPSSPHLRGPRILLDPVFSHRCSPSQWVGPARFTPAPCKVEEIPEVDAVVISHNHYDHFDFPTLQQLLTSPLQNLSTTSSNPPRQLQLFLPLNTSYSLTSDLKKSYIVHEQDWWESLEMQVGALGGVRITCTPAQHFTGRGLTDRYRALWASWAFEGLQENKVTSKVWFGGDSGYCSIPDDLKDLNEHGDQERYPICPEFKKIGEKFGGFDLGLIPIGAWAPPGFMSPIHCSPFDSARVSLDVQAKTSIGCHWGVWRLTSEPVDSPPKDLEIAKTKLGIAADAFTVMAIGETRSFPGSAPS